MIYSNTTVYMYLGKLIWQIRSLVYFHFFEGLNDAFEVQYFPGLHFYAILYKLLFSRGFYFREFREPDPRENFHFNSCLFIVMTTSEKPLANYRT